MGASDHATRQATVLDAEAQALPATTSVETNAGGADPAGSVGPPAADTTVGGDTSTHKSRLGHRPALDGLRGVAVVAVVLYHVGQVLWPDASGWLAPGGFVGVDLFFALSGFLITTLMLEEAHRRRSVDLGGFLERRAVRLLPALAVALGVIFLLALFGYGNHTPQDVLRRSVWNLAFLQNWKSQWRLITDLGHTWSLALEGQFYVLWSMTVAAVVALTRSRPKRRVAVLLAIAGVTAAAVGIHRAVRYGDGANTYILYLSTTSRLDGPVIGSIAGIGFVSGWFDRISPRQGAVAVAAGLAFFTFCVLRIDPFQGFLYQGGFTLYALVGAMVVVGATSLAEGRVHQALTVRPLVLLGTVSYSLFLWHIPTFFVIERSASDWPVGVKLLVGLPVAFVLAVASYFLVEQPVLRLSRDARARRRGRSPVRWAIDGARAWLGARTRSDLIAGTTGANGKGTGTNGTGAAGDAAAEVVGIDGLRPADRQRLRKAWIVAGTPVLLLYTWILTAGSGNLFQRQYFDSFFDAQGRSLLEGRWDVPPEVVGFEGFLINGRTYIYFGPLPALLRMPILAVTHRLDGRLTTLSMLAATLLLAWAAFRLTTAVRGYVRGYAPVTRFEVIATGFFAVAVLCGTPFWLGAETAVYHEAALWAVAFMVASMASLARWMLDPRDSRLAVATGLIAATLLTRQTLGLGGLVGLGCIGLAVIKDRYAARRYQRPQRVFVGARIWVLMLAGVVALAISIAPNMARFGKPFGVPVDRHVYTLQNEDRQEFLAANDGSFFGPQFLATNMLQYLRPDAFDVRPDLPWIDYPRGGPKIIGDVVFDGTGWSSSLPVTMPVLSGLCVVGLIMLTRSALRRRPEKWLVALWIGAAVGTLGVATIGYVAHRYMNDFYPAVLLPAIVGFHVAVRRFQLWRERRAEAIGEAREGDEGLAPIAVLSRQKSLQRKARGIVAGLAALLAFGVFANTAMALEYQREKGQAVPEWRRSAWVKARASLPFPKEPAEVPLRSPLPEDTWDGRLAVVGDCDALYVRVGENWLGVERGPSVGVYDLRVDLRALADLPDGQRAPLLTLGSGYDATVVAIARTTGNRVRFDVWSNAEQGWSTWMPQDLHGEVTLRIDADRYQPPNQITHDGQTVFAGTIPRSDAFALVGEGPELPGLVEEYPGDIALTPSDRSICRAVTD